MKVFLSNTYRLHSIPFFSLSSLSCENSTKIRQLRTEYCNIPPKILEKVDAGLIHNPNHPLGIMFNEIKTFMNSQAVPFTIVDNLSAVVSVHQNFDSLLVPNDHVSRKKSETYYVSEEYLLRAHTSAHQ
jgi:phenylalanyl-tRNA synthetase alpha chain